MPYITVDVDIDEFTDEELIHELELRGYTCTLEEYVNNPENLSSIELEIHIESLKPAVAGKNQLPLL